MGRAPSAYAAYSRRGNRRGFRITPRDIERLRALGRWYTLSPWHLVHMEQPLELWHPEYHPNGQTGPGTSLEATMRTVRDRLGVMSRIDTDASRRIGPLVGSEMGANGFATWHLTAIGASAASLPWDIRSQINPMMTAHAWMAADIGMTLERFGYHVLSERELSSGTDINGGTVSRTIQSPMVTSKGTTVHKVPDLAVLHPNRNDHIAVEIERRRSRNVRVYIDKLTSYRNNPAVKAVWYVCATEAIRKRVLEAATTVFGGNTDFPLRLYLSSQRDGFHYINPTTIPSSMMRDLSFASPSSERS